MADPLRVHRADNLSRRCFQNSRRRRVPWPTLPAALRFRTRAPGSHPPDTSASRARPPCRKWRSRSRSSASSIDRCSDGVRSLATLAETSTVALAEQRRVTGALSTIDNAPTPATGEWNKAPQPCDCKVSKALLFRSRGQEPCARVCMSGRHTCLQHVSSVCHQQAFFVHVWSSNPPQTFVRKSRGNY